MSTIGTKQTLQGRRRTTGKEKGVWVAIQLDFLDRLKLGDLGASFVCLSPSRLLLGPNFGQGHPTLGCCPSLGGLKNPIELPPDAWGRLECSVVAALSWAILLFPCFSSDVHTLPSPNYGWTGKKQSAGRGERRMGSTLSFAISPSIRQPVSSA